MVCFKAAPNGTEPIRTSSGALYGRHAALIGTLRAECVFIFSAALHSAPRAVSRCVGPTVVVDKNFTRDMPTSELVIPPGVAPGQQISYQAPNGQTLTVVVPPGKKPGKKITVPIPGEKILQVKIPPNAVPGQQISFHGANGTPFTIVVPQGARPGKMSYVPVFMPAGETTTWSQECAPAARARSV